jgi:uncharacterized protein YceK
MDLTNIALLFIVIALLVLVPCGCILTRASGDKSHTTTTNPNPH